MTETSNGLTGGTVAGLLRFLDWTVEKNYATPATISPLKSACKQIFTTVEGESYQSLDIRTLDRDDYFSRFQVAMQASGRLTPDSVRTYRARFTRALDLYNDYLTNGEAPKISTRGTTRRTRKSEVNNGGRPSQRAAATAAVTSEPAASGTMIAYPFPLETGDIANLRLPKRLGRRDAARLTAFINALIFEQPLRELGPASVDSEQAD